MSQSITGRQLYLSLPEIYRIRDNTQRNADGGITRHGDLALYLDACGALLDDIRATLDQRLADCFPDNPDPDNPTSGEACQAWLIPYFADLLDVNPASPEVTGQRAEVANAVSLRQRKGTPGCAVEAAAMVSDLGVIQTEGWRRLARTAVPGTALNPHAAYGLPTPEPSRGSADLPPQRHALHPGLPTVTPDFRRLNRAVTATTGTPQSQTSSFAGYSETWRHLDPHGAPCFPGSYEDTSRRTVDFRTPNWSNGAFHPKRLLLHIEPPFGYFMPHWRQREDVVIEENIAAERLLDAHLFVGDITIDSDQIHILEDKIIDGVLTVTTNRLTLNRCAVRKLVFTGVDNPQLEAEDSLFGTVSLPGGNARLVYCTVTQDLETADLQASDCIFAGVLSFARNANPDDPRSCIRYSAVPADVLEKREDDTFGRYRNTDRPAVFFQLPACSAQDSGRAFGDPGYAVLHPATSADVAAGAEDGGEMGAYHHRHYQLRRQAVLDKLADFLPVGIEPVLIPDVRLLHRPPTLITPEFHEE